MRYVVYVNMFCSSCLVVKSFCGVNKLCGYRLCSYVPYVHICSERPGTGHKGCIKRHSDIQKNLSWLSVSPPQVCMLPVAKDDFSLWARGKPPISCLIIVGSLPMDSSDGRGAGRAKKTARCHWWVRWPMAREIEVLDDSCKDIGGKLRKH